MIRSRIRPRTPVSAARRATATGGEGNGLVVTGNRGLFALRFSRLARATPASGPASGAGAPFFAAANRVGTAGSLACSRIGLFLRGSEAEEEWSPQGRAHR